MDLALVSKWAAAHHGLITRSQASELGVSRAAWYRAIASGRIVAVHPGVARLHGTAETMEQRIAAVVLAAGRGALASHRSAAYLLGLERDRHDPIEVVIGATRFPRLDGVIVHRPRMRNDLVPTTRSGIACTNELRTLIDLGAVDPGSVGAALEVFVVRGSISIQAVHRLVARHSRRGHPGVVAVREALAAWPLDAFDIDSHLEVAMAHLVDRYGLPQVEFHARVAGFEVDFLVIGSPIVSECDGWSTHVQNRDQWQFDLDRDARLSAAGYVVLRRSAHQILHRGAETARKIRDLVERWAPDLLIA
jgi:very-short-patch-repair endonuclease